MISRSFVEEIVREAGDALMPLYGKSGVKYTKETALDVVTEADLLSDTILCNRIRERFPDHGIHSEERGVQQQGKTMWYVDSLDGSNSFAQHIPTFCVMVAVAVDNVLQVAAIYLPHNKELFSAEEGKGAFLNGEKILCARRSELHESSGFVTSRWRTNTAAAFSAIAKQAQTKAFSLQSLGSIGIMATNIAAGRRDWFVSLHGGPWDYAAPVLILQEAGCVVTRLNGEPWHVGDTEMITANPAMHRVVYAMIQNNNSR
jgi:myo-inositol-1(or 4)-monophosphatase